MKKIVSIFLPCLLSFGTTLLFSSSLSAQLDPQLAAFFKKEANAKLKNFSPQNSKIVQFDSLKSQAFYFYQIDAEKGMSLAKKGLTLAEKLDSEILQAEIFYVMAFLYEDLGQTTQSLNYFEQSLSIYEKWEIPHKISYALFFLSLNSYNQNRMETAEGYAEESDRWAKIGEMESFRLEIWQLLSDIFRAQKDTPSGDSIFHLLDSAYQARKDTLAGNWLRIQKPEYPVDKTMVENILRAERRELSVEDSSELFFTYWNLASTLSSSQHWGLSEDVSRLALSCVRKDPSLEAYRCHVLKDLGNILSKKLKWKEAETFLKEAQPCFAAKNQMNFLTQTTFMLAKAQAGNRQFDSAYITQVYAIQLQDSLQQRAHQLQLDTLLVSLTNTQQKTQIQELEIQSIKARQWRYILIGGLLLFLIGIIYLIHTSRMRKRAHVALEEEKKSVETLLKDQTRLMHELRQTQATLIQQEKLASLGQLTAGVAHEINNPTNFINGNALALSMNFDDLRPLLESLPKEYISEFIQDLPEFISETQQSIEGLKRGCIRIQGIVSSLKTFVHSGGGNLHPEDIHELIESTLLIIRHKMGNIVLKREFGQIPLVPCESGKISQVFLNVFDNAIDAMEGKGELIIKTIKEKEFVEIMVSDTGKGILKEHLTKVFDPFFTTKEVGKGTGLGLSISYRIMQDHGGDISILPNKPNGTEVRLLLPRLLPNHDPGNSLSPTS